MAIPSGIYFYAEDTTTAPYTPKLGDRVNIAGTWSADGSAPAAFATATPLEIGGGVYWQPLAGAETDGLQLAYLWSSATAHVRILPVFQMTMPSNIKRGQGRPGFMYFMASSSDGKSPVIGITPTLSRSLDSGAFGPGLFANNAEVGAGWYTVDFAPGDTDADVIVFRASGPGCDTTQITLITQP